MSDNLGTGVSYVYNEQGYNYDTVVFQKGKPPLDSELNFVQQIQNLINQKQLSHLPSGWLSFYPFYTDKSLSNSFYTQNPTGALPEYAVVNGNVIYLTNTDTQITNGNLITISTPPSTGNRVEGIFLEVWKALLDPATNTNKPNPIAIIDSLNDLFMYDSNNGWLCGDNGLILNTPNGGQTWNIQSVDTKRNINGISFVTTNIGWAVGNSGVIVRTASGGQKWIVLTPITAENLNDIFAVDQLNVWAVGDSGTILRTSNGVSFAAQVSNTTVNLNKVYFYNSQVGWVVGDNGTILKTVSGGSSWFSQASGTTQNLQSIFFYDQNYGFAVGDNGTILKTTTGGSSWVSSSSGTSENLYDISMVPALDQLVVDEEVSSQVSPTNKTFTTMNKPLTKGDGKGTVVNNAIAGNISVKMRVLNTDPWTDMAIDGVDGVNGVITLANFPPINATVKVTYYYDAGCAVFNGNAWAVGSLGTILRTTDIGATWVAQTSGTNYNLYAVSFFDSNKGWTTGQNSIIKYTEDAGVTWTDQQSAVLVRQVQRVFSEGNIDTQIYLTDESIHPDTQIVTSKRVQVQYKIRVLSGVDPSSNPEAGLSSGILAEGPNATGLYGYENMGTINGDFGCWRAKCLNTVDGYCYAIPMFFVSRRNTGAFDPVSNINGSNQKNTTFIRPDLLVATNVVASDILDVRRKIIVPSVSNFLSESFDQLSSNTLKTNFYQDNVGGVRFGTELLQIDRIGGNTTNGGVALSNASIQDVMDGNFSSDSALTTSAVSIPITGTIPTEQSISLSSGFFHPNQAHYRAYYSAVITSSNNGKPIPGYFTGQGTSDVTFHFSQKTLTASGPNIDVTLAGGSYILSADYYAHNQLGLTRVPTEPQLVKNFSGTSNNAVLYQGVLNSVPHKVLEQWASEISGYMNYAVVYPTVDGVDVEQHKRAAPVELHYFVRVKEITDPDTNLDNSTTPNKLKIPSSITADQGDVPYSIYTIRRVNNITAGFIHRLQNVQTGINPILIQPVAGYEFLPGMIVEIVASVTYATGSSNVRNGASVNFDQGMKGLSLFANSVIEISDPDSNFPLTITNTDTIIGVSTSDTNNLEQPVCWVNGNMRPLTSLTGLDSTSITIDTGDMGDFNIAIQLLLKRNTLNFQDDSNPDNPDGLLIAYNYVPPQSVSFLPSTLKGNAVTEPLNMYISDAGDGGGLIGSPYSKPIEQISINDSAINDTLFNNKEPLQFNNCKILSGFAQLQVIVPGHFSGESFTLSGVSVDSKFRSFYTTCSREMTLESEGLQFPVGRKVYFPVIMRVNDPTNRIFMQGEYVMVIFSRPSFDMENKTGYFSGGNCSISVYRLNNRPISRI